MSKTQINGLAYLLDYMPSLQWIEVKSP